jgi:hypothetical protein
MRYFNFLFHPAGDRPALELSPHHTRMAGCYPDKKGFYHVSVDFIILSLTPFIPDRRRSTFTPAQHHMTLFLEAQP